MICWGGLSFVTVAASGWQMVVRYGSNGGNLVKERGGGASETRALRDWPRENIRVQERSCEKLHFEETRMVRYLSSRLDEREGRGQEEEKVKEDWGGRPRGGCSPVSSTWLHRPDYSRALTHPPRDAPSVKTKREADAQGAWVRENERRIERLDHFPRSHSSPRARCSAAGAQVKFPENNFHFSPLPGVVFFSSFFLFLRFLSLCVFFPSLLSLLVPGAQRPVFFWISELKPFPSTVSRTSRMRIIARDANMPLRNDERWGGGVGDRERALLLIFCRIRIRAELILHVMSFHAFRRRDGRFKVNCSCTGYKAGFD